MHEKLPSELAYAYSVQSKIRLSSLPYGIVTVNNSVTYITNEVLTSGHNCVSDLFAYNLHAPKQLANYNLYTNYCSAHPYKNVAPSMYKILKYEDPAGSQGVTEYIVKIVRYDLFSSSNYRLETNCKATLM
jgi:hypothetical protein